MRSSIARRLGLETAGTVPAERNVEGVVEMMLDATQRFDKPLTEERLFGWQAALFPTGRSGMRKIVAGAWRDDAHGPMQVVSGPVGRERVHYEAPAAPLLAQEVAAFLSWAEDRADVTDPVRRAALAHLWFVTIHPFDDGNGRIARGIADCMLARSEGSAQRGPARRHAVDPVVPRVQGPRVRRYGDDAGRGHAQSALLGAVCTLAAQRSPAHGAQPHDGWLRGQADDPEVGNDRQERA